MRLIVLVIIAILLAEFRAEVHGKPTLTGCLIRGFDRVDDGVCAKHREMPGDAQDPVPTPREWRAAKAI